MAGYMLAPLSLLLSPPPLSFLLLLSHFLSPVCDLAGKGVDSYVCECVVGASRHCVVISVGNAW